MLAITFVVAFPISAILDKLYGEEMGTHITRNKMKRMFEIYEQEKVLQPHEKRLLHAALELHDKKANQVMTPLEDTYMLDVNTRLDKKVLKGIYSKGYSRIPVYSGHRENIVGILLARDLVLINPDKGLITIKQLSNLLVRDVI
jgi:metal transporter CNNM